ncbi:hypothetical protein [Microlunatus ginsengisoli]|uniref:Lipoprotein n=1 Tax=Microlunatus ginsengisoli TaxID=363863 RepID=A0ABP7A106_9ACTN
MALRRRAPLLVGAVTALCLGAGACTPTDPPSASPSPSATPTETELERQTRLDFEAAEKAYRTFSAEYDRLSNAGGAAGPSAVMKENGAGPLLDAARGALRDQLKRGERTTGSVHIVWIRHGAYSPAKLTLNTCEDGSSVRITDKSGKAVGNGSIGTASVEVRKLDGRWKAWDLSDDKDVTSCDG